MTEEEIKKLIEDAETRALYMRSRAELVHIADRGFNDKTVKNLTEGSRQIDNLVSALRYLLEEREFGCQAKAGEKGEASAAQAPFHPGAEEYGEKEIAALEVIKTFANAGVIDDLMKELILLRRDMKRLKTGTHVLMPCDNDHAEAMIKMGRAYLESETLIEKPRSGADEAPQARDLPDTENEGKE